MVADDYRNALIEGPWPAPSHERLHMGYTGLDVTAGLLDHWGMQ